MGLATPSSLPKTRPTLRVGHGADPLRVPVLEPRRGSLAARLAAGHHPVTVFLAVIACGLALMASLSVGLGLLVSDVLVHHWGIGADDEWLPRWLAAHRDP